MYAFYPYQLSNANAFKVREQSGRKALGLEACSNSSSLRWTRGGLKHLMLALMERAELCLNLAKFYIFFAGFQGLGGPK